MVEIKQKLQDLLAAVVERQGAFLVELAVRHDRGARLVQVFVDTDPGITIEQCAEISREFGRLIDAAGIFERSYRLEVSSPGTDKPLRYLRQFRKNVGRRFKVTYLAGQEKKSLVGGLEAVSENALTFVPDAGESVTLEFSNIIEAREELPW